MCRKCIKYLIKQIKQCTSGTVKPIQQRLNKLQTYNIQNRMTKSVRFCEFNRRNAKQSAKS